MDLRLYYHKLRKAQEQIQDEHVVMVSLETADGGRAGVMTEFSKTLAARMIVEGRARLADKDESAAFYKRIADQHRAIEESVVASRVQLNVISEADLRSLQKTPKTKD